MGLCGMPEAELAFEEMEVTPDRVLMPPGGFKRGFAELINAYNSQRVGGDWLRNSHGAARCSGRLRSSP